MVPAVSRDHPVPTQPGSETDHADAGHGEYDHQPPGALLLCENQTSEPSLPILNYPRPKPEGRGVELDDLLMLERTERLLTHCVSILPSVSNNT